MSLSSTKRKVVGIAEMVVSNDPEDVIVTYSLGSCLGIVLYDIKSRVGGMIHVMLPDSGIEKVSKTSAAFNPAKYVDTGVPLLIQACMAQGLNKKSACLSVFGGAQIFDREDYFNIGKRNYISLRKAIWQEGLLITHEHVGGRVHRTVKIELKSGEITLDVNKEQIITYHCNPFGKG
jgi:chemotaxis protein CheD